jgi:hypothetical protein
LGGIESLGEHVDDRDQLVELLLQLSHGDGRVVGRLGLTAQAARRELDRQPSAGACPMMLSAATVTATRARLRSA